MKKTHPLILASFLAALSGFAELYDDTYLVFASSLGLSLGDISSCVVSLGDNLFDVGTEWIGINGISSNRVISVSGPDMTDEEVIRVVKVESVICGTGERGTVFLREYAASTNAFQRMILSYVGNSMPTDLSLSRCEKFVEIPDCGILRYPVGLQHTDANIVSLSVVRGNILLTTWGFSGSNHVQVALSSLNRAFGSSSLPNEHE